MRLLLLLLMPQAALSVVYNWLSLALLNTSTLPIADRASLLLDKSHYEGLCAHLTGLNPVQQSICTSHPFSIPFVSRGLRDAIYECQQQFKFERWNCSDRYDIMKTPYGYFHDILGKTLRTTTKESSYLAAIASAGIVHAVTKARNQKIRDHRSKISFQGCNTGNFSDCGCDSKPALQRHLEAIEINPPSAAALTSMHPGGPVPYPRPPGMPSSQYPPMGNGAGGVPGAGGLQHFSWGGCSDNVGYGVRYARKFLDEFERQEFNRTSNVQHLVAIHNYFVGREAIVQNVRKHCRCHGVSGSCEFKTCWLQMPKMKDVAELLKKRYDNFAVQVTKRAKKRLRRKERSERATPIRGNEMAFVVRSPTYCERNDTTGILGTTGRDCVHDSLNSDSCDLLCCGRGYNTRIERQVTQCNCKFVWCCQVKCKECVDDVAVHTCK